MKGKTPKARRASAKKPALLAGGNPQIAKADGDAPVQAYIAAMPGWKRDVAVLWHRGPGLVPVVPRLHSLRQSDVLPGQVAAPASSRRVQAQGSALLRHLRNAELDEAQMAAWIRQAAALPGWAA